MAVPVDHFFWRQCSEDFLSRVYNAERLMVWHAEVRCMKEMTPVVPIFPEHCVAGGREGVEGVAVAAEKVRGKWTVSVVVVPPMGKLGSEREGVV